MRNNPSSTQGALMKTIETTIDVPESGQVTIRVPKGISPGPHSVVLIIDDVKSVPVQPGDLADFPVDSVGKWPVGLSLRREDMYDDRDLNGTYAKCRPAVREDARRTRGKWSQKGY
jgi:hypothetical protein